MAIQDTLIAWAKGKALNEAQNGYPRQSAFARYMLNPGDTADKANAVDPLGIDDHIRVDAAVSELRLSKPVHFQVICLAYLCRKRDVSIARILRTSRSSARALRENAEYWIDGRLGDIDRC